MSNKKPVITRKKNIDENKINNAKGLSKKEQAEAAVKQEKKLKTSKPSIQEFDEWK